MTASKPTSIRPVSDFSLENVKIKMKLVVKYNSLKCAENEKKSQPEK